MALKRAVTVTIAGTIVLLSPRYASSVQIVPVKGRECVPSPGLGVDVDTVVKCDISSVVGGTVDCRSG
ncbi:MAG: hypothetical protein LUQ61_08020 [Methanoregulaceae archaeon]|nr:hypothetical protein [Methanoregulaceae archaeon]